LMFSKIVRRTEMLAHGLKRTGYSETVTVTERGRFP
jgi:hypothetical protein